MGDDSSLIRGVAITDQEPLELVLDQESRGQESLPTPLTHDSEDDIFQLFDSKLWVLWGQNAASGGLERLTHPCSSLTYDPVQLPGLGLSGDDNSAPTGPGSICSCG